MKKNIRHPLLALLRQLFPWLSAVVLIWWLLRQYPADQLSAAMQAADYTVFLPVSLVYFLYVWSIDCIGMAWFFERFLTPIRWTALLAPRARTYLFSLINYGAGQAALAVALKREHKLATGDAVASFLLLTLVDLVWVTTLAFLGTFFVEHRVMGVNLSPTVQAVAYGLYAATLGHLLFWGLRCDQRMRGRLWQRALGWLNQHHLVRIFQTATLHDYATIALLRLPIHFGCVGALYCILHAFHGIASFSAVLANVPIAMLVGTIPISWGGVGTSNKVMVDLLTPHLTIAPQYLGAIQPEALLLTMSLAWMLGNYLLKLIFGVFFLVTKKSSPTKQKIGCKTT